MAANSETPVHVSARLERQEHDENVISEEQREISPDATTRDTQPPHHPSSGPVQTTLALTSFRSLDLTAWPLTTRPHAQLPNLAHAALQRLARSNPDGDSSLVDFRPLKKRKLDSEVSEESSCRDEQEVRRKWLVASP